jgi:hypothetical protein
MGSVVVAMLLLLSAIQLKSHKSQQIKEFEKTPNSSQGIKTVLNDETSALLRLLEYFITVNQRSK